MTWTIPQIAVCLTGVLHLAIMLGELLPWSLPYVMHKVLKGWNLTYLETRLDLAKEKYLIATIVHNSAIYNGIVGAALIASAFVGADAYLIQCVLLTGVIVAGLIGTTLSWVTIFQALAGAIALAVVIYYHTA